MAVPRPSETVPEHDKRALLDAWLEATARTYPEQTVRNLLGSEDRFRNPVGHALREGLPVLLDAVLGEVEFDAVQPVLDGLLRIRAVQGFDAGQAVAFVYLLKPLVGEQPGRGPCVLERIDCLALLAFDAFTRSREKLRAVQANEARRRTFLPDRMRES